MRRPSVRILKNTVALYRYAPTQDGNGFAVGDASAYSTLIAASVPCSVQAGEAQVVYDVQQRPSAQVRDYLIVFASDPGLAVRDKIVWIDDLGISHTIFASGPATCAAGRLAAWEAHGTERL